MGLTFHRLSTWAGKGGALQIMETQFKHAILVGNPARHVSTTHHSENRWKLRQDARSTWCNAHTLEGYAITSNSGMDSIWVCVNSTAVLECVSTRHKPGCIFMHLFVLLIILC